MLIWPGLLWVLEYYWMAKAVLWAAFTDQIEMEKISVWNLLIKFQVPVLSGANEIASFSITMKCWNRSLWLNAYLIISNQSERIISV